MQLGRRVWCMCRNSVFTARMTKVIFKHALGVDYRCHCLMPVYYIQLAGYPTGCSGFYRSQNCIFSKHWSKIKGRVGIASIHQSNGRNQVSIQCTGPNFPFPISPHSGPNFPFSPYFSIGNWKPNYFGFIRILH